MRPKSAGKSLTTLIRRDPAAARLLGGIAEAAPYLWDAIDVNPARLTRLLLADPNLALAALLEKTHAAAASARSQAELMRILRDMKTEAALLIALADIGGVWELTHITEALTRVADTAVSLAVNHLLREAMKNKKLKPPDPKNPPLYLDLPTKDGQPQPEVLAKWTANSPLAFIDQFVDNLREYHGISIDVGDQDAWVEQPSSPNAAARSSVTPCGGRYVFPMWRELPCTRRRSSRIPCSKVV